MRGTRLCSWRAEQQLSARYVMDVEVRGYGDRSRSGSGSRLRRAAGGVATTAAITLAFAACVEDAVSPAHAPAVASARVEAVAPNVTCDPTNGGLTLPPGFCAVVVARDVGFPRHMAVRPNGDLYVALSNSPTFAPVGNVLALRDTDGDGRADVRQRFGPTGGNGIAWHNGELFFAPDDRVLRWTFAGNELVPTGPAEVVVSGLPTAGDHYRKTVVVDDSDGLFVNIGSATNSCQVANRVQFSPGISPCPELATRAGVWKFSASGTGQTQASGTRFASEVRNANALAINPVDGKLYGAINGRDELFYDWPNLYTLRDDFTLPAEELVRLEQGKRYGWPYCYYDPFKQLKVRSPEYGGDGSKVGACATRERPIDTYPAHWAPLSMLFYTGTQFPQRYRNGLFVAFHGSRFDPLLQPAGPGYVVTFTPWQNGQPQPPYEIFADNFAQGDPSPTSARFRAVGLAQGPDGSLYISDDKGGWIWRVVYVGGNR